MVKTGNRISYFSPILAILLFLKYSPGQAIVDASLLAGCATKDRGASWHGYHRRARSRV